MVLLYTDTVRRKHYAGWISRAAFIQLILWAFLIIFPFFVGFATNNFWIRESTYTEQPRVAFKNKFIFLAQGKTVGDLYMFSSVDQINQFSGPYLRAIEVLASTNDTNADSKPESLRIKFKVPLLPGEEVHQVSALMLFEVLLQDRARILMEGMAYIEHSAYPSGATFYVDGEMAIKQAVPFPAGTVRNVAATSLIDPTVIRSIEDASLSQLLSLYAQRNDTTVFKPTYSAWVPGNSDSFEMTVVVRVPQQVLRYRPNFLETVKFAWIQYLSLFWATWFFVSLVRDFVFRQQIVPTRVVWETRFKKDE